MTTDIPTLVGLYRDINLTSLMKVGEKIETIANNLYKLSTLFF